VRKRASDRCGLTITASANSFSNVAVRFCALSPAAMLRVEGAKFWSGHVPCRVNGSCAPARAYEACRSLDHGPPLFRVALR